MNENTVFLYENAIGAIRFAYDSPFWLEDIEGISSVEVDISQSRSNEQVGSSTTGRSVQPRIATLTGSIFEPLDINREQLIAVFAPKVPSTLTMIDNGESWYLDVEPLLTPDPTPGNGIQKFQARLHAAYPYWRTSAAYAKQVAGLTPLFKFPFSTGGKWWISKYSDNYFSTIENKGNVPVEFRVTFSARSALSHPEIYHVDTGRKIRINKSLTAGEKIIVSTVYGQKGVVCIGASGETSNGFKYLSIDSDLSMALMPGSNLLRIDAQSNREGLGVRVEAPEGVKSGV